MNVTFLRFNGQDSAYVFMGSPLDAYRAAIGDQYVTEKEFRQEVDAGEVSFVSAPADAGLLLAVGNLV